MLQTHNMMICMKVNLKFHVVMVESANKVSRAELASYEKTAQFLKFVQPIKVGYNRRNQSAIHLGQRQVVGNQETLHQNNS